MLVPLLLDLGGVIAPTINATATATFPQPFAITVIPPGPLWVLETPEDKIYLTPSTTPVGSYQ